MKIQLVHLEHQHRAEFIRNNQLAFQKAFTEAFGASEEMVLPQKDVEQSLDKENAVAYRIISDEIWVGGVVLSIDEKTGRNSLDLFFVNPEGQGKGIGTKVWQLIEKMYPKTKVWETHTPYFEKRNIHFYVNKCGFHIVEFFNPSHPEPNMPPHSHPQEMEYFFRFEKNFLKN